MVNRDVFRDRQIIVSNQFTGAMTGSNGAEILFLMIILGLLLNRSPINYHVTLVFRASRVLRRPKLNPNPSL